MDDDDCDGIVCFRSDTYRQIFTMVLENCGRFLDFGVYAYNNSRLNNAKSK